jgi:16S rRNA processing protein RimM
MVRLRARRGIAASMDRSRLALIIARKSPAPQPSLIRIGRIIGAHGLRGALRFRPDDPTSESIQNVDKVFLAAGDAASESAVDPREFRVVESAPHTRGTMRLILDGINDLNLAEPLIGKNVFVNEADLPAPEENEFYYRDVIGCEVFLTDGTRIGAIEDIIATGANDVFVVREDGREVLVPVIEDVVKGIDAASKRVVIEAIPGLLD